jgi:hypothetical protein
LPHTDHCSLSRVLVKVSPSEQLIGKITAVLLGAESAHLQLVLGILRLLLRLLLRLFCASGQMAHDPLVSALNALANFGEGRFHGVGGAILEIRRLLAGFGYELVDVRALGDGLWLC